jgi:hypothetical protein
MWPKKGREKVVAEIAAGFLVQVAREQGISLERSEAVNFLNEGSHAYEMWRAMMCAGEDYVRFELTQAMRARTPGFEITLQN